MSRSAAPRLLAVAFAFAVLLALCVRVAWVGDDAYITLRSVENWARGNGLCWNTMDRVQTYTHPLWMLVLAAGRAITGECYFATIGVSLLLSMLALVMLLWRGASAAAVVTIMLLLGATRAFADYATSGLETPMTYLLLVLLVRCRENETNARRRYVGCVLLASLLACNRMDLALLALPVVLSTMRGIGARTLLVGGTLAVLPFVAWLGFAFVYYGTPLPVTAFAKAFGTGIPTGDLVLQGLYYLGHTALHDPVLFVVVLAGIGFGLLDRRDRWLALGALLYVGYVVKVGGDFMAGRFLLPPFVVAVAILAPRLHGRSALLLGALALGVTFVPGLPPWLRSPASDTVIDSATIEAQHGIVDERRMHYVHLGLLAPLRQPPRFGELNDVVWPEGRSKRWFLINGSVGVAGFQLGALGHLIDPLLCDPLLARLPARDPAHWRIGHVLRRFPEGYFESLASGENRIVHPALHRYYEALRVLMQAPVFSSSRLATACGMLLGNYRDDLRAYVDEAYFTPPRLEVAAEQLPRDVPLGTFWFDDLRLQIVYDGGIAVTFASAQHARTLRLQTMGMVQFRCRFVHDGKVVGETMATPQPPASGVSGLRAVAGLREEIVAVPAAVEGFDRLWIDAVEGPGSDKATGPPAVGWIRAGD